MPKSVNTALDKAKNIANKTLKGTNTLKNSIEKKLNVSKKNKLEINTNKETLSNILDKDVQKLKNIFFNQSNKDGKKTVSLWNRIKNKFLKKTTDPIGPNFVPYGKSVQEGVNPNSLIPTKDLSTLDNQRMQNAVKYGGEPIIVDNLGNVLDGHHRLKYAIKNNKAVDVSIGY